MKKLKSKARTLIKIEGSMAELERTFEYLFVSEKLKSDIINKFFYDKYTDLINQHNLLLCKNE